MGKSGVVCTSVSQIKGPGKEQDCGLATVWRQVQRYSQGEGNVLTLGHCAVQRNLEGLVVLLVILSPRKVNLDLVMEYCREGHWYKARQSSWIPYSSQTIKQFRLLEHVF